MAKSKKKKKNEGKDGGLSPDNPEIFLGLKEGTVRGIGAIIALVFAIFLFLASFDLSGVVGSWIYDNLSKLFGVGYFFLPLVLLIVAVALLRSLEHRFNIVQGVGALIFFVAGLGMVGVFVEDNGGMIGGLISSPLTRFFDMYLSVIILFGLLLISFLVIFNTNIPLQAIIERWKEKRRQKLEDKMLAEEEKEEFEEVEIDEKALPEEKEGEVEEETKDAEKKSWSIFPKKKDYELEIDLNDGLCHEYIPPPISILKQDKGKPGVGDIKASANIIKRTLFNFGITVEMDEISVGPTVTRYALKPAEGVKLSRIVGLQNDLALSLAAHPIRIEAPIPGKSLVGIEIPNTTKSMVGLGTLLEGEEYQKSDKPLLVALGKSISGTAHFANIAKMPHLLIAGATGAGKSVTIHALITSLLYRNSPENLKMIMVDPKRVELTMYNSIPHLLTPVITAPKDSILALKWAAKEMERRYNILEAEQVRDIDTYHKKVLQPEKDRLKRNKEKTGEEESLQVETMPYIVIVIDELADIMTSYPRELEAAVVRLAQMSRAVGIHLILSTQRPSVNVITGLIKANIPSRLALQVTSQVDSRTILDTGGAERLLGAGDMLFMSGEMSKPARIQAPFISEDEVKKVVAHLKQNWHEGPTLGLDLTVEQSSSGSIFGDSLEDNTDDDDELYEDARELVIRDKKASTSYLQRKLKVGYSRAARLIDMLEERSVIGPGEGAKPREIFEQGWENDDVANINEDERNT